MSELLFLGFIIAVLAAFLLAMYPRPIPWPGKYDEPGEASKAPRPKRHVIADGRTESLREKRP